MNRLLFPTAFLLGAAAVLWMGSGFLGSDRLALGVTLVIGGAYSIGFLELVQFRRATTTLGDALLAIPGDIAAAPSGLANWLNQLHPSLQTAVRLRIEGERVGLPAPIITPYLVGLLVMLGLLGTFIGMVVTLQGAVFALEGTTELQAIRAGLAAPIQGLSLAFGTSVAGVAASAMLGLASTLSRRDRMLATRLLDDRIAAVFRGFSLTHNRQETYRALQDQARALPEVAATLQVLAEKLERMGDQLGDKLTANQQEFQHSAQRSYSDLAESVGSSLRDSLAESGRLAGEGIRPLVGELMTTISSEAERTCQQVSATAREQLETLSSQFTTTADAVSSAWQAGLEAHQRANQELIGDIAGSLAAAGGNLEKTASNLLGSVDSSTSAWLERQQTADAQRLALWSGALDSAREQAASQLLGAHREYADELRELTATQQAAFSRATGEFGALSTSLSAQWQQAGGQMNELTSSLKTELSALRTEEALRGQAAVDRLAGLETTVAAHIAGLGRELEEPMARLIKMASETPRAAAEVIGQLRAEISNNIERDNSLLTERQQIMANLQELSTALEQSSHAQREALASQVTATTTVLQEVAQGFTEQVGAGVANLAVVTENLAGSSIEMSSLGEAFSLAVKLFNESNGTLVEALSRIEGSLQQSTQRSDDQMAYYVAQAREIIDQSLLSQQEILARISRIDTLDEPAAAEAG